MNIRDATKICHDSVKDAIRLNDEELFRVGREGYEPVGDDTISRKLDERLARMRESGNGA